MKQSRGCPKLPLSWCNLFNIILLVGYNIKLMYFMRRVVLQSLNKVSVIPMWGLQPFSGLVTVDAISGIALLIVTTITREKAMYTPPFPLKESIV